MKQIGKLGKRLRWLSGAIVVVILLMTLIQNTEVVRFVAFIWELNLSLSLLLLLILLIGFALGYGLKTFAGHRKPKSG